MIKRNFTTNFWFIDFQSGSLFFKSRTDRIRILNPVKIQDFPVINKNVHYFLEYIKDKVLKLQVIFVRFSPLHNVPAASPTLRFPSLLLVTGDHDDKVVPHHSYKYVATVQDKLGATSKNPILLKVNLNAGHGVSVATTENKVNIIVYYTMKLDVNF